MPERGLTIAEVEIATAWNVRGDPGRAPFVAAAARVLGMPPPARPNASARAEGTALLWLGPRSWLLVAGPPNARSDFDAARHALNDAGGALFEVSSTYVAWMVAGADAARALNRGCPLDFDPRAFPAGGCAQSVLGHIGALFHKPGEAPAFVVMVARSFADDARDFLIASAATGGYRLAAAVPFGTAAATD